MSASSAVHLGRGSKAVMQRPAKPCRRVRLPSSPPDSPSKTEFQSRLDRLDTARNCGAPYPLTANLPSTFCGGRHAPRPGSIIQRPYGFQLRISHKLLPKDLWTIFDMREATSTPGSSEASWPKGSFPQRSSNGKSPDSRYGPSIDASPNT
jgi:hypothetical protein